MMTSRGQPPGGIVGGGSWFVCSFRRRRLPKPRLGVGRHFSSIDPRVPGGQRGRGKHKPMRLIGRVRSRFTRSLPDTTLVTVSWDLPNHFHADDPQSLRKNRPPLRRQQRAHPRAGLCLRDNWRSALRGTGSGVSPPTRHPYPPTPIGGFRFQIPDSRSAIGHRISSVADT